MNRVYRACALCLCLLLTLPLLAEAQQAVETALQLEIAFTFDGQEIRGKYSGQMKDGVPAGECVIQFTGEHGSWKYEGIFEKGVFVKGTMTDYPYAMTFDDPVNCYSAYTGPFVNNRPEGDGVYKITRYGEVSSLEGHYDVQSGGFNGKVTHLAQSADYNGYHFAGYYSGEYQAGKAEGQGYFIANGNDFLEYTGTWSLGEMLGTGAIHTNVAALTVGDRSAKIEYEGHIEDNKFEGDGVAVIEQNGQIVTAYSGQWSNGLFSGEGTLYVDRPDEVSYTYKGEWKEGLYDGEGELVYTNGNYARYKGNFSAGLFRPTFVQLLRSLYDVGKYTNPFSEQTADYLEKHQNVFLEHRVSDLSIDPAFSYFDYVKNCSTGVDRGFNCTLDVIQAKEYAQDQFGIKLTEFTGYDSDQNIFHGYYFDIDETIKAGKRIEMIAYPLGYSPYRNSNGDYINALRFVACTVEAKES